MSNLISNYSNQQQFSISPANGRQTVGDGAFSVDAVTPDVLAVCQVQGSNDIYYYSTTFSGGSIKNGYRGGVSAPTQRTAAGDYSKKSIPHSAPRDIPISKQGQTGISNNKGYHGFPGQPTPPLTPDASPGSGPVLPFNVQPGAGDNAEHDFLVHLFPGSARVALKHAKSVRIASSELAVDAPGSGTAFAFEGIVLDAPGHPRTLYIDGKDAENVKLRESIVALLDLADEHLECSALVIALERSSPALAGLLHSFLYVGATVVTRPPYPVDDAYVLVGIEI
ncbi:uncharacterized protein FOMMEDRAFT_123135 [Fomitiporia mediterranea MF3/22]|uniref:uncharacterized protein n=1 Tax=Fomitiporia mediterranea (strain MF3/22) TaxID=694068 RepID=UPI0004408427|nr:uncharacterized protein FOMMEDRAFT_123135 [Fomitiporia mediterranea MF3/22]EJD03000.1 hypothetical protein FOMMEDRAFT_123135 [Fomitiporia mediterranea MF3/22]